MNKKQWNNVMWIILALGYYGGVSINYGGGPAAAFLAGMIIIYNIYRLYKNRSIKTKYLYNS